MLLFLLNLCSNPAIATTDGLDLIETRNPAVSTVSVEDKANTAQPAPLITNIARVGDRIILTDTTGAKSCLDIEAWACGSPPAPIIPVTKNSEEKPRVAIRKVNRPVEPQKEIQIKKPTEKTLEESFYDHEKIALRGQTIEAISLTTLPVGTLILFFGAEQGDIEISLTGLTIMGAGTAGTMVGTGFDFYGTGQMMKDLQKHGIAVSRTRYTMAALLVGSNALAVPIIAYDLWDLGDDAAIYLFGALPITLLASFALLKSQRRINRNTYLDSGFSSGALETPRSNFSMTLSAAPNGLMLRGTF